MIFFKKTIFTGFMPNMSTRDILTACSFIFFPWKWAILKNGDSTKKVEKWLKEFLNISYALTFDSGRSSLFFALKSLGAEKGTEVLVQAYTCLVVTNAINWTGAKPVYVDVKNDFNMDPNDLEKKITPKTKILIIQHTFGHPADIDKLTKIAKKHNIKVVEDCAHSLGVKYKNKYTGTYADLAIYSFGGEKVISSVRGGAIVTNDKITYSKLKKYHNELNETGTKKIIQHLLKYPIFSISKIFYSIKIGKVILAISKKISITSVIISSQEKQGIKDKHYPTKFPNALASILLNQIKNIEKIQKNRNQNAKLYIKNIKNKNITNPQQTADTKFLRYTILSEDRDKIISIAKQKGVILGTWYNHVVTPEPQNCDLTGYIIGSCPVAEKLAKTSLNLPIHHSIKEKQITLISKIINSQN